MTKDTALKLALEALEDWDSPMALPAIYAIKEALAQDELCSSQEPVAWTVVGDGKFGEIEIGQHAETDLDACSYWVNRGYSLVPLYTTPPKRPWVGLTGLEQKELMAMSAREAVFATEDKLKEKNT